MKYFYLITLLKSETTPENEQREYFGWRPTKLIDQTPCFLLGKDYGVSFHSSKIEIVNDYIFKVNGNTYSYHLLAEVNELNECYYCKYKRDIDNSAYLFCSNPCSNVKYDQRGKDGGWFFYPLSYDPIWKTNKCSNFKINKTEICKPW